MRTDILHSDGVVQVKEGDFVVGPSDDQHVDDLIIAIPGNLLNAPLRGVGIGRYLKKSTNDVRGFVRSLQINLEADGYSVSSLDMSRGISDFGMEYELTKK